jgi:hypothetical protein
MVRKWKAGSSREMGVEGKTATSAKKVERIRHAVWIQSTSELSEPFGAFR